MTYKALALAAGLAVTALSPGFAADLDNTPPVKAKAIPDVPFFLVNDNRLTFEYQFTATDPGAASKTAKEVVALTHFDVWAYGTNFFLASLAKSDQNDPAGPCGNFLAPVYGCAGAAEFYGFLRSTFSLNEIFHTKAFSYGILRGISLEAGGDVETENNFLAPNKKDVVAGLQFAFDLPYKGFFNVAPLYYQEWNHNSYLMQPWAGVGYTGLPDGNTHFHPTWAVEINYYMDLGFLPPNLQYFAISGRAGFYGKKGDGAYSGYTVAPGNQTAVEINSEPIRLTFDASKLMWGPKYSHFLETWVAYRYWQNKFGLDDSNPNNATCYTGGVNNHTCTEKSLSAGVTAKF